MQLSKRPNRRQLQALMELPHGEVQKQLIKSKLWDWSKDPNRTHYQVNFTGVVSDEYDKIKVYGYCKLWARDIEHAKRLGDRMGIDDLSWEDDEFEHNGWDVEDIDDWELSDVELVDR